MVWTEAPFRPTDRQMLQAGYNTYWESVLFGYHDKVQWVGDTPERAARMAGPHEMSENGADVLMRMIFGRVIDLVP